MELQDKPAQHEILDARDMLAVHNMFRREFGLMPGLVRNVASGDWLRVARVADHVALVTRALHSHHSAEDRFVWPLLRGRGSEDIAAIVDLMEEQHGRIDASLREVTGTSELWRKTAALEVRDSLADASCGLLPALHEHLRDEERHVVPLIEKYIAETEYARVAREAAADLPSDKLPTVFGMVIYGTPPEVVEKIVTRMPEEVRPVIREIAMKAYAAYAYELYGTSTPALATRGYRVPGCR